MRQLILWLSASACAALVAAGSAEGAPRPPLTSFAVAPERGLADTLALCDLTAFLETNPNLDADVIYAADEQGRRFMPPLRHPYFRPANLVFDNHVRTAVQHLEGVGLLRRADVAEARTRYDADMLEAWRHAGPEEHRFLDRQFKRCGGILKGYLRLSAADGRP